MTTKRKSLNVPAINRFSWPIIGLFLVILVLQSVLIARLYAERAEDNPTTIKMLIVESVRGFGRPGVVEPLSGKTYLADFHLVLPAQKAAPLIKYGEWDGSAVAINDVAIVNQAAAQVYSARTTPEVFKFVPSLQACSRQIIVRFAPQSDQSASLIFTKPLVDGRTAFIYKDAGCHGDATALSQYIEQIDSY